MPSLVVPPEKDPCAKSKDIPQDIPHVLYLSPSTIIATT